MRTIISTVVCALFLTTALETSADDAVKTSQPPYKFGRQLDDEAPATPATAQQRDSEDQSVRSARAPYKPGRQADEQSDADSASKK